MFRLEQLLYREGIERMNKGERCVIVTKGKGEMCV